MKRTLLILVSVLMTTSASADERSEALLGALQQKVAGWGDYRVDFTVTIGGQTLGGSFEVSGESYRVTTPEIEIFCDGATKYEVNPADREVAIDRVDPLDRTVMGNPTRLFDFFDGSYTHRYVGAALIDGVNCERIELREIAAGASQAGQTIDVFLSAQSGLPVRIGYTIGFMSTEAAIDLVRITPRITIDRASFSYDPKRYAGYEIIDFR